MNEKGAYIVNTYGKLNDLLDMETAGILQFAPPGLRSSLRGRNRLTYEDWFLVEDLYERTSVEDRARLRAAYEENPGLFGL